MAIRIVTILLVILVVLLYSDNTKGHDPYESCKGGEQGYVASTYNQDTKRVAHYVAARYRDIVEEVIVCWIPGNQQVTVQPPEKEL